MAQNDLHIVGVASNTIWHTILFADGSAQDCFGNVSSEVSDGPSTVNSVDCAADGANLLHLMAVSDTALWRATRFANGKNGAWKSPFENVSQEEKTPSAPATWQNVRAATGNGLLHVAGMGSGSATSQPGPWHTSWQAGGWQPDFDFMPTKIPALANMTAIACATDSLGYLYVVGSNANNGDSHCPLVYAKLDPKYNLVSQSTWVSTTSPGKVHTLHCSIDPTGNLYVAMINDYSGAHSGMYATLNTQSGEWSTNWNSLGAQLSPQDPNAPHSISHLTCVCMPDGLVTFVAIGSNTTTQTHGGIYTTVYGPADRSWTRWNLVNAEMSNGSSVGRFTSVGASAVPSNG